MQNSIIHPTPLFLSVINPEIFTFFDLSKFDGNIFYCDDSTLLFWRFLTCLDMLFFCMSWYVLAEQSPDAKYFSHTKKRNRIYSIHASLNMGKYLVSTYLFNLFLSTIMVGQQVYNSFIKWAIVFERKPFYLNNFIFFHCTYKNYLFKDMQFAQNWCQCWPTVPPNLSVYV